MNELVAYAGIRKFQDPVFKIFLVSVHWWQVQIYIHRTFCSVRFSAQGMMVPWFIEELDFKDRQHTKNHFFIYSGVQNVQT